MKGKIVRSWRNSISKGSEVWICMFHSVRLVCRLHVGRKWEMGLRASMTQILCWRVWMFFHMLHIPLFPTNCDFFWRGVGREGIVVVVVMLLELISLSVKWYYIVSKVPFTHETLRFCELVAYWFFPYHCI